MPSLTLLQTVAKKTSEKIGVRQILEARKQVSKLDKKAVSGAFDKALAALNAELAKKGKTPIRTSFELERVLKKDKALREKFYSLLGEELQKLGARGDKEVLGKVAYKNIIRYKKMEEYRRYIAGGLLGGLDKATEDNIAKLQGLYDTLANKFGTDAVTFYYKYNTDAKFRKMVNIQLMREIHSDPTLSKLPIAKERPEVIIHSLASLRATSMTRADKIKFIAKQLPKRAGIEFMKASVVSVGSALQYMATMPTMVVMQSIPQLSGVAFMTMHSAQYTSQLYAQTLVSAGKLSAGKSPHLLMDYAVTERLRQQIAEAEKNGIIYS